MLTADYWKITLPNELATSAAKSPALLAYIAALNIFDADALCRRGKFAAAWTRRSPRGRASSDTISFRAAISGPCSKSR